MCGLVARAADSPGGALVRLTSWALQPAGRTCSAWRPSRLPAAHPACPLAPSGAHARPAVDDSGAHEHPRHHGGQVGAASLPLCAASAGSLPCNDRVCALGAINTPSVPSGPSMPPVHTPLLTHTGTLVLHAKCAQESDVQSLHTTHHSLPARHRPSPAPTPPSLQAAARVWL